jgi:hypothetical protein
MVRRRRERVVRITDAAARILDGYAVRWEAHRMILTCRRCEDQLYFHAKEHVSWIEARAQRHRQLCEAINGPHP